MNDEEWTEADDVIEEVREMRRKVWARFDNDPKKLIDYYIEHDKHYTGPVVTPAEAGNKGKSAA
jgi:hypothetical protein